MRSPRFVVVSLLLTSLSLLFSASAWTAYQPVAVGSAELHPLIAAYHATPASTLVGKSTASDKGGIREEVPAKYMARYQQWKQEFLSTETGRQQWADYQNNPNFTLTVIVSRDNPRGGTTSNYKWNDAGQLVAAIITLGCRLDAGVPNPVYFPVMN